MGTSRRPVWLSLYPDGTFVLMLDSGWSGLTLGEIGFETLGHFDADRDCANKLRRQPRGRGAYARHLAGRALGRSIGLLDTFLWSPQGVHEFAEDPACVPKPEWRDVRGFRADAALLSRYANRADHRT